jgi:hypothetical protein
MWEHDSVILARALVVEAIHLGDLATFMVASYERDVGGVTSLHQEEIAAKSVTIIQRTTAAEAVRQRLHAVVASVDEIAHENVALVWDLTTNVKQLQQIMKLAVNITANSDGRSDGLHGRFLDKQHLHHVTQLLEVGLW